MEEDEAATTTGGDEWEPTCASLCITRDSILRGIQLLDTVESSPLPFSPRGRGRGGGEGGQNVSRMRQEAGTGTAK